jgi:hypothetical protein
MTDGTFTVRQRGKAGLCAALALIPLLSGCLGAVAIPLVAGGTLFVRDRHRVRAATPVPVAKAPRSKGRATPAPAAVASPPPGITITTLKELPPPSDAGEGLAGDAWGPFLAYAERWFAGKSGQVSVPPSALLEQPPATDSANRLRCKAPVPAVVIDLDQGAEAFVPERLAPAPPSLAEGLARLRQGGTVVLWISGLPAARAADVAEALRRSGLDPQGLDQLLLIRKRDDRKQLLRQDASKDVCIVAIAGDERGDFDELFDYLRNPGAAVGLYRLMGQGWFLVPSLATPPTRSTER